MVGMRRSNLWGGIVIVLMVCSCCLSAEDKYGGGTGEPNDPYQIWDANHMQAIGADANDWDNHFVLMADIDLSQFDGKDGREKFNIIGNVFGIPFTGIFDGNDNRIVNYDQSFTYQGYVGMFGHVGENGEIMNLGLESVNLALSGVQYVGSLIGYNEGTITNCYGTGTCTIFESGDVVGGVSGRQPAERYDNRLLCCIHNHEGFQRS